MLPLALKLSLYFVWKFVFCKLIFKRRRHFIQVLILSKKMASNAEPGASILRKPDQESLERVIRTIGKEIDQWNFR